MVTKTLDRGMKVFLPSSSFLRRGSSDHAHLIERKKTVPSRINLTRAVWLPAVCIGARDPRPNLRPQTLCKHVDISSKIMFLFGLKNPVLFFRIFLGIVLVKRKGWVFADGKPHLYAP